MVEYVQLFVRLLAKHRIYKVVPCKIETAYQIIHLTIVLGDIQTECQLHY